MGGGVGCRSCRNKGPQHSGGFGKQAVTRVRKYMYEEGRVLWGVVAETGWKGRDKGYRTQRHGSRCSGSLQCAVQPGRTRSYPPEVQADASS